MSTTDPETIERDRFLLTLDFGKMSRVCTVDERFQLFNVEMIEVIGGRF